jgi:hypothetical protein
LTGFSPMTGIAPEKILRVAGDHPEYQRNRPLPRRINGIGNYGAEFSVARLWLMVAP